MKYRNQMNAELTLPALALAAMDEEPLFRQQWSYEPQGNERVNIFLTNTLEDLEHTAEQLGPLRMLSDEANSAYEVKKHKPVLVVLGNVSYASLNRNDGRHVQSLPFHKKRNARQRAETKRVLQTMKRHRWGRLEDQS